MAGNTPPTKSDAKSSPVFKNVKYYLIGPVESKIEQLLNKGGGKRDHYLSEMIDYVIVDDVTDPEYSEAKELFERPCVTTRWVELSVRCECLLPTEAFSPEAEQVFSGFTVCPSQLSRADARRVWALVTYHGGRFVTRLTKHVTHLVTTQCSGAKYTRMHTHACSHPERLHTVTPDWVTESVRDGPQPEALFHPRLLLSEKPPEPSESAMDTSDLDMSGVAPLDGKEGKNVKTKEALAAMVSTRIMQSWKAPELEPLPPAPAPHLQPPVYSPMFPHMAPRGPRSMLRNITNNGDMPVRPLRGRGSRGPRSPRSPRGRSPGRTPKISQLVGMGYPGPHQFPSFPHPAFPHPAHVMPAPLPPPAPRYYGHEPLESVPESVCLLGCVFYITDYDKYLQGELGDMLATWRLVIEQSGGEVDESYSNRVTHVLCEHQHSDVFSLAIKDGKRVVTAHWLNDVLLQKSMRHPWHAIHLPNLYGPEKPCKDQIICVTNFEGEERTRIKHMLTLIGAKYTGYLTAANSVLIAKKAEGQKFDKATEWKIPVVNVSWLQDILLGDLSPLKLPVAPKYLTIAGGFERLDLFKVARLMEGWRTPVRIPKEAWKKFSPSKLLGKAGMDEQGVKRKSEDPSTPADAKRPRLDESENIPPGTVPADTPVVLITGLPRATQNELKAEVIKLGGQVSSTARACTHLVANQVQRTVKFLTALSVVRHVVTADWVTTSSNQAKFVEEGGFTLVDARAEQEYGFKLSESLQRAHSKPLFKGLTFYNTPSVQPSLAILRDVINSAGGTLVTRRPSLRHIREYRDHDTGRPTFMVITCDTDLHLCADLTKRHIAVHNVELVFSGIIRQEVDMDSYRLN